MELARLLIAGLLLTSTLCGYGAELSPALKELQGKWKAERPNRDGERYSYSLEFKGNKITFEAKDASGDTRLVATGTAKTEKAGPLDVLWLSDLRAGRTADELQEV